MENESLNACIYKHLCYVYVNEHMCAWNYLLLTDNLFRHVFHIHTYLVTLCYIIQFHFDVTSLQTF